MMTLLQISGPCDPIRTRTLKAAALIAVSLSLIGNSAAELDGTSNLIPASHAVQPVVGKYSFYSYSRIPLSFGVKKLGAFGFLASVDPHHFSESMPTHSTLAVEIIPLPREATMNVAQAAPMFEFASIGFPNIEKTNRQAEKQYKPYRNLVKLIKKKNGKIEVVPNVACHGYSVEKTLIKASRYDSKISSLAARYRISPDLVKAVIAQESCFRTQAVSPVGARGLMQLMPETAQWLGVADLDNPDQNLRAGIKYLSNLKRRFGSNELALAAYNAGPGNVNKYDGIPPFAETQQYVKKVMHNFQSYSASSRIAGLSL